MFRFECRDISGLARHGVLHTPRGIIRTPAFMPVGTAATVKGMYPDQLRGLGVDIVLANTYHLMLRPGAEEVAALGGLHRFMGWEYPILTDSGGYQIMSLGGLACVDRSGVRFRSHIDGSAHILTPARSIRIQALLGSNICMVLDECTPYPVVRSRAASSMRLSMEWAARSREAHEVRADAALFGIVQGGVYEDLRLESAEALNAIGFDGYAIGGLAVGEGQTEMLRVLDFTVPSLPCLAPRYLMGVGTPLDIVEAVARGVDMFDCVLPTRAGRHGTAYTWHGKVNMRNARHARDSRPIDSLSACPASCHYSRAYIHHLFKCGELLGAMLLTWHNLAFYQELMVAIRDAIAQNRFDDFVVSFRARQSEGDIEPL